MTTEPSPVPSQFLPPFEVVEMVSTNKPGDRIAMAQMNAELRNAQLELLSAQCATDRLRLRFSVEDVARHGQREVVLKAVSSANSLCEYYNYLVQYLPKESEE
jgi:Leu/Phe-tRNA-protein transferase